MGRGKKSTQGKLGKRFQTLALFKKTIVIWLPCYFMPQIHSFRIQNKAFSHDVKAALLLFQNNETAAMLVYQDKPVGIELCSYVKTFFCLQKISIDAGHVSDNALLRNFLN